MWQVIDDGIGYDTKREMAEILDERLSDDAFYEMWTAGVLPVWRVRVLLTEFLGEAWDRVTARLDAEAMFKKKGWGMVVGDENDKVVRMPELPDYSWSMADFGEDEEESVLGSGEESNDEDAPEELAVEEESEEEDGDESSDEEEEEVDPGPWQDTEAWKAVIEPTTPKAKLTIAHKFLTETGWEVGTIKSKCRSAWAVKYPSELQQYVHDLNMAEYGPDGVWLVVRKA